MKKPSPSNNFAMEVTALASSKKISYLDAIVLWCEKNNLELETAAYWVKKDPALKDKLKDEGEILHFLKKEKAT